jgi:hypothetical protein
MMDKHTIAILRAVLNCCNDFNFALKRMKELEKACGKEYALQIWDKELDGDTTKIVAAFQNALKQPH